jgi:hypothetical protein
MPGSGYCRPQRYHWKSIRIEALIVTADWKPVAAAEVEFAGSRAFPRYRTLWPEEG